MGFVPYSAESGRPSNRMTITIDRLGRLYLNKKLQEELGCVDKTIKLYIAYDPETKRIGLAKPGEIELEDVTPLTFGKDRAYASARGFLSRFQIDHREARKYVYVGKEGPWMAFELDEDDDE